jgi:predicted Zn-dependent peptidase
MSSRLFEEVREKRGLAYDIRSGVSFFEDAGAVTVSAGVEPKKARLAVHVIMRELKRLKNGLVPKEELGRAKDYFLGQFFLGLEDTLDRMIWVGDRTLYRDELPDERVIRRSVEAVTSDDIRALARRVFHTKQINFALIGPYGDTFEKQIERECDCD